MIKKYTNHPLLPYNTFGMDVQAALFVEYDSVKDLTDFLTMQSGKPDSLLHIGGGSNLLFTADYKGVILHSAIKGYEVVNETDKWIEVRVGAGETWDDFVAYTIGQEWYGAENLSLIPGEVGASAVQNIGAYGVEVKDLIVQVETICVATGAKRTFSNAECHYTYRNSIFKQELKGEYIVTHVVYRLSKQPSFHLDYGNIRAELEKEGGMLTLSHLRNIIIRIREAKLPDPKTLGNAGSFFMNPVIPRKQFETLQQQYPGMPHYAAGKDLVKIPAGWMIDQCGWKGKGLGPVAVYDKQALVLVNRGGATGKEVIHLAHQIIVSVENKFGVTIHPEVNFI